MTVSNNGCEPMPVMEFIQRSIEELRRLNFSIHQMRIVLTDTDYRRFKEELDPHLTIGGGKLVDSLGAVGMFLQLPVFVADRTRVEVVSLGLLLNHGLTEVLN